MIMIATTMLRWTMVGRIGGLRFWDALVGWRWWVGDEVGGLEPSSGIGEREGGVL